MHHGRFVTVLFVIMLLSSRAPAQSVSDAASSPSEATPSAGSDISLSFDAGALWLPDADLDDSGADVSMWRADVGVTIAYQASDQWRWSLDIGSAWYSYDFDGDTPAGPGDILDDALTHDLRLTAVHIINDTWSIIVGGTVHAAYEDDADFDDSLTFGGFGAAGYKASDRLSWQFGAAVRSQLEDDALVIPYIGVQYQVSDVTTLRSKGLGLEVATEVNDKLSASIFAQFEFEAFRLADDNPVLPEGVFEDRMVIIGASATWTPVERFSITGALGAVVWRELEFRDDDGDEVGDTDVDPAPAFSLQASFSF